MYMFQIGASIVVEVFRVRDIAREILVFWSAGGLVIVRAIPLGVLKVRVVI